MVQAYASFEDKEGDGRRKKFSFRGEVVAEGGVGGGEGEGWREEEDGEEEEEFYTTKDLHSLLQ